MREINKEISLKIKTLAKIRKKIKLYKRYAFLVSLQDTQDFDSNPYNDDILELQLQELSILQQIQFLKREIRENLQAPSFSLSNKVLEVA